jgi:hypothetical protein
MGEFDFYYSFYGLLLSLSAGTVIIRCADAISERNGRHIGLLTPLLGTFILLDITSFWIWAWRARAHFHISYASMYFGLGLSLCYFFAATQVFPKEDGNWKSLDEHYWARKRYVLPGIILANAAVIAQGFVVAMGNFDAEFYITQAFYWVPLIALMFTRNKWVDTALLAALCLYYVLGAFVLGW